MKAVYVDVKRLRDKVGHAAMTLMSWSAQKPRSSRIRVLA